VELFMGILGVFSFTASHRAHKNHFTFKMFILKIKTIYLTNKLQLMIDSMIVVIVNNQRQ